LKESSLPTLQLSSTPSAIETVETSQFRLTVYPDIIEFKIKANAIITEQFCIDAKFALAKLASARPNSYVLAESEGFIQVSKKARKLAASKEFSSHMTAIAFYTTNYALALLGELYNKINKPAVPVRIFTNRQVAREWLVGLRTTAYASSPMKA
jgi:hypothetical protein